MGCHKNSPVFRRKEIAEQIRQALFKLKMYRDGVPLSPAETLISKLLDHSLTPKEKTYLEHYYLDRLTHKAIAKRLSVDQSAVTKGIKRAERKIEPFIGIITNPNIDK